MNLKKIRLERGLTQKQLADKCNMSVNYIANFESGSRDIAGASGRNLLIIAKALECTIEELLK